MYEKFKTEELLECELTNEEYHERSDLLAKKNQERQRLESEKKAVTSEFSAKVNAAVAEINKLSLTISTRRESRNVKIEIKYNNPIVGQKTFIRADT
jgi:septin family protein